MDICREALAGISLQTKLNVKKIVLTMLVEKRSTNDDSTYLLSARRQGAERRRGENIGDKSQNIERVLDIFFR